MSLKHVVVGGGTGFIGRHLIDLLSQQGITCTIVSRNSGANRMTWADVERHGLPKDTSAVVNVAGIYILNPLKRKMEKKVFNVIVRNSRIRSTEILAKAVENVDATSFVTISGISCYVSDNTTYSEEDKCVPYDFLSELCHDWEAAAKLSPESKTRQVVIRSGVVLGKDGGIIKKLYWPFFVGLGGHVGSGNQYMPWIHITDLVNLFLFAMTNDNVKGILNGVAPQLVTNKEFVKAFATAMRRPALIPIPKFILNAIYTKERAALMLHGPKVLPKRTQELGFEFRYADINSAFKDILG